MNYSDLNNDYFCGYHKAKLEAIEAILKSENIKFTEDKLNAIRAMLMCEVKD